MPNAIQRQYQATEADVKRKRKVIKPEFMKKYNLTYAQIGEMFGYSNANSFHSAPRRQKIIDGVEAIIQHIENQLVKMS